MVFTTKRCSCEVKQTHLCLTLLEHYINTIAFFRRKSNEYKLHDRININTPFFIVFCRGCCSISQRENQLHGKILLKTLILNNRVRLDKEFGSFYFYDSIFRSNPLAVDFLHCNKILIITAFRLMLLCPCQKAKNKKWR